MRTIPGFTLMETTFSLGILLLGLVASVSLMVATIAHSQRNQYAVVVANLAREGIEIVRLVRDTKEATSSGNGFDDTFPVAIGVSRSVVVDGFSVDLSPDAQPLGVTSINDCTNCDLWLDGGRYVTAPTPTAQPTIYKRLVMVTRVSASEGKVEAVISWKERSASRTLLLEEHLFDWR